MIPPQPARARVKAAAPRGNQFTGLCWCWSRWGYFPRARRLAALVTVETMLMMARESKGAKGERGVAGSEWCNRKVELV